MAKMGRREAILLSDIVRNGIMMARDGVVGVRGGVVVVTHGTVAVKEGMVSKRGFCGSDVV